MWSVSVFLLACVAVPCTAYKQKRIIGGSSATSAEFPYMGSLQEFIDGEWEHICGCMAYTTTKALTAAHCLDNASPSVYRLVFGTIDITNNEATAQISALTSFTKHPSFTSSSVGFSSDIAVLRLQTTLDTSSANVGTISLFSVPYDLTNTNCTVLGWGALSNGVLPDVLQSKNVTVTSQAACDEDWSVLGVTINSETLCATDEGFSERDSGGPLVCMEALAGLVSFGGTCAATVLPNVYTSISFFNSWIQGQ
ncbi:chymotrypsin-like serine proteinase [Haliotis rubra]|uniref:chymotrypsin-like serine proteinase n=1 Tax=Haliotis rubra TaxID=36100 RepID=UPI001EE568D1|nr:chymotrypsin-like serine proteinase [Haliotis rubra]